ncbi:MAG: hypothetical protein ACRC6X_03760 [Culicoidibacterales bacterium]
MFYQETADSINGKIANMTAKTVQAFEGKRVKAVESIEKLKNSGLGITEEQYKVMLEKANLHTDEAIRISRVKVRIINW